MIDPDIARVRDKWRRGFEDALRMATSVLGPPSTVDRRDPTEGNPLRVAWVARWTDVDGLLSAELHGQGLARLAAEVVLTFTVPPGAEAVTITVDPADLARRGLDAVIASESDDVRDYRRCCAEADPQCRDPGAVLYDWRDDGYGHSEWTQVGRRPAGPRCESVMARCAA